MQLIEKALKKVNAKRISTSGEDISARDESVSVIAEAPLLIDVEGVEQYTLLCTPIDELPMAAGFLFSEGVIESIKDVISIEKCKNDPGAIRVKLKEKIPKIMDSGRNLLIVSACGACGTEEFSKKLANLPAVGSTLRIDCQYLRSANKILSKHQPLFETCGGAHIAGIFDRGGELVACAEDLGRHNALDKSIGKCLFDGITFGGCWAVLSCRVSLEMVCKCARAGIELISAISAPTSLSIETADRLGITLCAFVRETRATVFTHAERIVGLGENPSSKQPGFRKSR